MIMKKVNKNVKLICSFLLVLLLCFAVKVDGAVPLGTVGYYKAEISNAMNGILPFTGGSGLLIYSVFGILIIGIAAYMTFENQRKKNVQE